MTVESDGKFKEKSSLGFKNNMRNVVNFNASSGKSENLHFDVLLLLLAHVKFQLKKAEELSLMTLKSDPNFEKKFTFYLKNDMRSFMNFNSSSGKSENLYFDGMLLSKVCNV